MTLKQYWFNQLVGLTLILFGAALSTSTATGHHMIGLGMVLMAISQVIRLRRKLQTVQVNSASQDRRGAPS